MYFKNKDLKISPIGLNMICHYEGYSPTIYLCPSQKKTIGIGHLVRSYELERYENAILTKEDAMELLKKDMEREQNHLRKLVKVPLTQNQWDALSSLIMNIGAGNFSSSTLLKTLNRGHKNLIPMQIKRWIYSRGRRLNGLIKRRGSECGLWNSYYDYKTAEMFAKYLGR